MDGWIDCTEEERAGTSLTDPHHTGQARFERCCHLTNTEEPSEYDEPQNSECRCETPDECADIVDRMDKVGLPDGEDLMFMLAAALGYTLTQTDA